MYKDVAGKRAPRPAPAAISGDSIRSSGLDSVFGIMFVTGIA